MEHRFKTWPESAAQLIAVAAGRAPADTVILGGQLVNVHTREILRWDVAISKGRIAYVGPDAGHCVGDETQVLQTEGFVAFCPWAPSHPFEFWISPKKQSMFYNRYWYHISKHQFMLFDRY